MLSRLRLSTGALWLMTAHAGCAVDGTVTAQNVAAISGGTDDATDTGVVIVGIQFSDGSIASCSGSLLLPNLVLTARHCVSTLTSEDLACSTGVDPVSGTMVTATTASAPLDPSSFFVSDDETVGASTNFMTVSQVFVPPNSTDVPICGQDYSLLLLSSPMTHPTLIVPRLDEPPFPGESFTAVGYGETDPSGAGVGTRRVRSGLTVQLVGALMDGPLNIEVAAEWMGDTGTCQGDSGGPALDGIGQVMGSLSRGAANSCDNPTYERLDLNAAFIRQVATQAVSMGGFAAPSWITPPVANTANFGDECVSDAQCVLPYVCLIVGNQRRCTDESCNCPSGWACGMTEGTQACLPETDGGGVTPTADAGTMPPADAGATTPGPEGGTAPDAGTTAMMHGGCSASRSTGSAGNNALGALAVALALFAGRRRRVVG